MVNTPARPNPMSTPSSIGMIWVKHSEMVLKSRKPVIATTTAKTRNTWLTTVRTVSRGVRLGPENSAVELRHLTRKCRPIAVAPRSTVISPRIYRFIVSLVRTSVPRLPRLPFQGSATHPVRRPEMGGIPNDQGPKGKNEDEHRGYKYEPENTGPPRSVRKDMAEIESPEDVPRAL